MNARGIVYCFTSGEKRTVSPVNNREGLPSVGLINTDGVTRFVLVSQLVADHFKPDGEAIPQPPRTRTRYGSRAVVCVSQDGSETRFETVRAASRIFGSPQHIVRAASGKVAKAYKMTWRYDN